MNFERKFFSSLENLGSFCLFADLEILHWMLQIEILNLNRIM